MNGGGREGQACLKTSQWLSYPFLEKRKGLKEVPEEKDELQDFLVVKEDKILYCPLALFLLAFPPAVPALGFFLPRRS